MTPEQQERFWSHTDRTGECWMWTNSRRTNGYGQVMIADQNRSAHRVAYELSHGPIADGLRVDHICRNRACINPTHLRAVTHKQNCENRGEEHAGLSGVRGVTWDKARSQWHAAFTHNYRSVFVGRFDNLQDAAAAVKAARAATFTHSEIDKEVAA